MNYLFMPLSQHFDDGFGATGEAFEQSAKLLSSNSDDVTYRFQIPLCFLYRHAIELYLKSAIVVLHRDLSIPYGKNSHAGPAFVLANKKWKPIYQVHSVAQLWEHVSYLIRSSKSELERRCKTDWLGEVVQQDPDARKSFLKFSECRGKNFHALEPSGS